MFLVPLKKVLKEITQPFCYFMWTGVEVQCLKYLYYTFKEPCHGREGSPSCCFLFMVYSPSKSHTEHLLKWEKLTIHLDVLPGHLVLSQCTKPTVSDDLPGTPQFVQYFHLQPTTLSNMAQTLDLCEVEIQGHVVIKLEFNSLLLPWVVRGQSTYVKGCVAKMQTQES